MIKIQYVDAIPKAKEVKGTVREMITKLDKQGNGLELCSEL